VIPEAPTVAEWKRDWLPVWDPGRFHWRLTVQCPYAPPGKLHVHRHGGGVDPAGPYYGSRVSDCMPGGVYTLRPA
jgi:hypothetical protein